TELENTIMNIEQSEKTYKLLLQTLPEGIVIINPMTNKHIYRNEASIRMLKIIGLDKLNESIRTYIKEENYGEFKRFTIDKIKNIDISLAVVKREEEGTLIVVFRMLDYEFKSIKLEKELNKMKEKNKIKTEILSNVAYDIKKTINTIFEINNKIITLIIVYRILDYEIKTIQLEKEINKMKEKNKFKTELLSNVTYDIKKPINTIFEINNKLSDNKGNYNSENINNHTRLVTQNC